MAIAEIRTCPNCTKERVLSPREARKVFSVREWGATSMLDDADRVCSFCFSARINGTWKRMKSVEQRARELGMISGSKSAADYQELLTAGETEDRTDQPDRGVDNADDLEW